MTQASCLCGSLAAALGPRTMFPGREHSGDAPVAGPVIPARLVTTEYRVDFAPTEVRKARTALLFHPRWIP